MPSPLARRPGPAGALRRLVLLPLLALPLLLWAAAPAHAQFWFSSRPMPEFGNRSAQAWINSAPLTREELAGKVVLIEVWTSI